MFDDVLGRLRKMPDGFRWTWLKPPTSTSNLIILALLFAVGILLLQGNVGFSIADEGFLWYGTIQVLKGNVPIRDFQSYDPAK